MSDCHPLGVVGRGSETQLQVGKKLDKITSGRKVNKSRLDINSGYFFFIGINY